MSTPLVRIDGTPEEPFVVIRVSKDMAIGLLKAAIKAVRNTPGDEYDCEDYPNCPCGEEEADESVESLKNCLGIKTDNNK